MESNKSNEAYRIMDVIYFDSLKGSLPSDFDEFELYEVLNDGNLRRNRGIKHKGKVVVYDVSDTSDEFKEKYKEHIHTIHYHKIVRSPIKSKKDEGLKQPSALGRRIISILPLDGVYSSLGRDEFDDLGCEFVTASNTPNGIEITPVISLRKTPDNMFLVVDSEQLSERNPALLERITPEIVELYQKENGYYGNPEALPLNVTVMPIDGVYESLTDDKKALLGSKFVAISDTPEGLKVDPVDSSQNITGTVYLVVQPGALRNSDRELLSDISSELVELSSKDNGCFANHGEEQKTHIKD